MKTKLLERLRVAKVELDAAEADLQSVLAALITPNKDTTMVTAAVSTAFDRVRVARTEIDDVERLLIELTEQLP